MALMAAVVRVNGIARGAIPRGASRHSNWLARSLSGVWAIRDNPGSEYQGMIILQYMVRKTYTHPGSLVCLVVEMDEHHADVYANAQHTLRSRKYLHSLQRHLKRVHQSA